MTKIQNSFYTRKTHILFIQNGIARIELNVRLNTIKKKQTIELNEYRTVSPECLMSHLTLVKIQPVLP